MWEERKENNYGNMLTFVIKDSHLSQTLTSTPFQRQTLKINKWMGGLENHDITSGCSYRCTKLYMMKPLSVNHKTHFVLGTNKNLK